MHTTCSLAQAILGITEMVDRPSTLEQWLQLGDPVRSKMQLLWYRRVLIRSSIADSGLRKLGIRPATLSRWFADKSRRVGVDCAEKVIGGRLDLRKRVRAYPC